MAGTLILPELPENALANIRNEIGLYFGEADGSNDKLIDGLIDEVVKDIHRRWHFSWTRKFYDVTMPIAGFIYLPQDFKKLFEIRNQALNEESTAKIQYTAGTDYLLGEFNSDTPPLRLLRWIPGLSSDLSIRIWYYRKPTRVFEDNALIDIENDSTDVVKIGVKAKRMAMKSNLEEYDRLRMEYEDRIRQLIDDDTSPDMLEKSIPYQADYQISDFSKGEIAGE